VFVFFSSLNLARMQNYDSISFSTLKSLLDSAKWVWKSDANATESDWVLSCYTPGNAIAGWTDYENHLAGTMSIADYKEIVYKEIATRLCQIGNYYNINAEPFDTVVIIRTRSGWSANAAWSNGTTCYFTHIYAESAARAREARAIEDAARKARAKERRDAKRALTPKPAKKKTKPAPKKKVAKK
jgi:hypothetical protein